MGGGKKHGTHTLNLKSFLGFLIPKCLGLLETGGLQKGHTFDNLPCDDCKDESSSNLKGSSQVIVLSFFKCCVWLWGLKLSA